ncbi:unnamed protein product [Pleuronectes platessa]|uniref:Uncharacterized protein n=1 Tax=Pleuronectes platessa TaxID=8262 RepID=A0A9N7Z0Z5_PLEPL|nr:unnamed protein product [Pleuronectes platessa]
MAGVGERTHAGADPVSSWVGRPEWEMQYRRFNYIHEMSCGEVGAHLYSRMCCAGRFERSAAVSVSHDNSRRIFVFSRSSACLPALSAASFRLDLPHNALQGPPFLTVGRVPSLNLKPIHRSSLRRKSRQELGARWRPVLLSAPHSCRRGG